MAGITEAAWAYFFAPLVTLTACPPDVTELPEGKRVPALQLLTILLPPCHIVLLEQLVELFVAVSANAAENLMTAKNLARILAPNILRPKGDAQVSLEDYEKCTAIFEVMLDDHREFARLTSLQVATLVASPTSPAGP